MFGISEPGCSASLPVGNPTQENHQAAMLHFSIVSGLVIVRKQAFIQFCLATTSVRNVPVKTLTEARYMLLQ